MEIEIRDMTRLRAAVLNPLTGWRHELMSVPEWNNERIAVRDRYGGPCVAEGRAGTRCNGRGGKGRRRWRAAAF